VRGLGAGRGRVVGDGRAFLCLSFVISYVFQSGVPRQGEVPRAACGLIEARADGERVWPIHNIVMI
jgi:hypothetical protein